MNIALGTRRQFFLVLHKHGCLGFSFFCALNGIFYRGGVLTCLCYWVFHLPLPASWYCEVVCTSLCPHQRCLVLWRRPHTNKPVPTDSNCAAAASTAWCYQSLGWVTLVTWSFSVLFCFFLFSTKAKPKRCAYSGTAHICLFPGWPWES